MKPILCLLALFTALTPALAQDAATAPVAASQTVAKSVTLDNGLVVTPLKVPDSDWQQMTDTELWKFSIKAPPSVTRFNIWLQLRETGKVNEIFNAWENVLPTASELTFGIYPKEGSTFESADTWRIYSHLRDLQSENKPQIIKFDRPNPIKELSLTPLNRAKTGAQVLSNDGLPLLEYGSGTKENPTVTQLVLVLVPQTPKTK